jgi:hypothetical protein
LAEKLPSPTSERPQALRASAVVEGWIWATVQIGRPARLKWRALAGAESEMELGERQLRDFVYFRAQLA